MARIKNKDSFLVTQYLGGISSKALEKYQHILKKYADNRHGIYALYKGDKLYYVGLAKSLKGRIRQHLKDKHAKKWDKFSMYLTLDNKYIRELETLLLQIVSPKGNTQKGRFLHAENLHRKFSKDVRNELQEELSFVTGKSNKLKKEKSEEVILLKHGVKKIRAHYKGKTYRASVLKDGSIKYNKERYRSPSAAANAIRKRATNGWLFWYYERSPGDWMLLDSLRK